MEAAMMPETIKDVLNRIFSIIEPPLKKNGFSLKGKNSFELIDGGGNIYIYEILISKRKGYFSLHLRLVLKNNILMKKVNCILAHALNDESYVYPVTWDEKTIQNSKKIRLSGNVIAMLTDWRVLKGNETLENFNKNFSVWMCVFDDIKKINNWESQLLKSIDYAICWFSDIGSYEWIVNNTQYPSLYLLKKCGDIDRLKEKYIDVLSKSRDKIETELYFKHLNSM